MAIWRVPYRWLPRTFWKNIRSMAEDIFYGIRNVMRWTPVIWFDADFDWEYLAVVMEYKLNRMADALKDGHHVGSEIDARRCRVCAQLIARLRGGIVDYADNAKKFFGDTSFAVKRAGEQQKADKRYLGLLIGKYLDHWWD